MSGTSLDGVDAAVLITDGERIEGFGETAYRPYTSAEREVIARALGCWDGPDVVAAAKVVERAHLEILGGFDGIDLVGFHGQTLAHAPRAQGTLQVGDGGLLAAGLGVPVVWDFRTEDVARGGEGAPLAPFFHFACAEYIAARAPVAFLNLGGVGNLTYVDPSFDRPEVPGALLAFDTGPANAPIDDLMRARRGVACDRDGALAATGRVDEAALARFLDHPYFRRPPPKSLDRNDFAAAAAEVAELTDADAAATLTAMSAAAVQAGLAHCPKAPERLLVTGGGRRNPVLMAMLRERLACAVLTVEDVGLDGDMLEAQAFAYLAARVARGLPTSCPGTTGVPSPVSGGRLGQPGQSARVASGA